MNRSPATHRNRRLTADQQHLAPYLPPEGELGPAMLALNDRQRLFVLACMSMEGRMNRTKAVKMAGYTGTPGALKVQAHRLAHDQKVQDAFLEEARKRMRHGAIAATELVIRTVGNPKVDIKERLKAAGMVLDRGGLPVTTEHKVTVENVPREEKLRKLYQFIKDVGGDPRSVFRGMSDAMEGDFKVLEEIEAAEPAAVEHSAIRTVSPLSGDNAHRESTG